MGLEMGNYYGNNAGMGYNSQMPDYSLAQQGMACPSYPQNVSFNANPQNTPGTTCTQISGNGNSGLFATTGLLATGGAAGYGWFSANPINEKGEFNDKIINSYNEKTINNYKKAVKNEIIEDKVCTELGCDKETVDIAKKIKNGTKFSELTKEEKAILKKNGVDKNKLTTLADLYDQKIKDINMDEINKQVEASAREFDLKQINSDIAQNNKAKEILNGLNKPTKADLEKVIKENPKAFGITATEPEEIEKAAKELAKNGKTKLMKQISNDIKTGTSKFNVIKKTYNNELINCFDKDKKAFVEKAPEEMASVLKDFKLKRAGKFGAIAAGIALVAGMIFGNNN